jgi:hypothetical protein
MIANDLTPKQFLKMSRVIFFALFSGLMTFLIMVLFISDTKSLFSPQLSDPLLLGVFLISCIAIPSGYLFAKKIFNKIDPADLLKNKLIRFQSGQLIRLATCEGVGMLAIVSLMLTSNYFFLIFLLIAFFGFVIYYPTPEKIGREINLTENEIEMFYR